MPRSIHSINNFQLDILQAVKRAFLHRGYVTKKSQRPPRSKITATTIVNEDVQEGPDAGNADIVVDQPGLEEKKAEEGPEQLVEVTENSQEVLYEATTVFPFTLVPDTLTLDREKLTIAQRFFWRTATITSVPVSEILSAQASVGPFFGSVHLVFSFFADNQKTVSFFWRNDAIELQRLLHGYIIAHKRKINCTTIDTDDLKILLHELGSGASD